MIKSILKWLDSVAVRAFAYYIKKHRETSTIVSLWRYARERNQVIEELQLQLVCIKHQMITMNSCGCSVCIYLRKQ
jgi:hypothetical protein